MGSKLTNILIGILAVAILAVVFIYSRGGTSPVTSGLIAGNSAGDSGVAVFLRQVSAVRAISLSKGVFSNKVLVNGLRDESKEIPPDSKGRANPFAPIDGQQAAPPQAPATASISIPIFITPVATPPSSVSTD